MTFGFFPHVFLHRSARFWAESKALNDLFPSPLLVYQRDRSFLRYPLFRRCHAHLQQQAATPPTRATLMDPYHLEMRDREHFVPMLSVYTSLEHKLVFEG